LTLLKQVVPPIYSMQQPTYPYIFFGAQSSAHYKQLVLSTPKGSRNIYEL